MVNFKLNKHYLVKPKISNGTFLNRIRSPGVYTTEVDGHYITNTTIIGGDNITTTRSNTFYTENLEVTGEVRQHGGIRYNENLDILEMWDSRMECWVMLRTETTLKKKNIFKRIYDYFIQRFSI